MPDRDQMLHVIQEYCRCENEKDKQGWLDLFTPDAVHEDPVGKRTNAGLEKIAGFWDSFQPLDVELWQSEEPIICGHEAIVFLKCKTGPKDNRRENPRIIDQFIFNDEGKITGLRAFY